MEKLMLVVGAALLFCCGDEPSKKDSSLGGGQSGQRRFDACTCPLWELEVLGNGRSTYYCEFYADNSDCNNYDIQFAEFNTGLPAGVCGEPCENCDPAHYGHLPCLPRKKPRNFDLRDHLPPNGGTSVIFDRVIEFEPKPGATPILARVFLVEGDPAKAGPAGKKKAPYRLFGVGYEIEPGLPPVTTVGHKYVKKAGPRCHFDVELGTVKFHVFTTDKGE